MVKSSSDEVKKDPALSIKKRVAIKKSKGGEKPPSNDSTKSVQISHAKLVVSEIFYGKIESDSHGSGRD